MTARVLFETPSARFGRMVRRGRAYGGFAIPDPEVRTRPPGARVA